MKYFLGAWISSRAHKDEGTNSVLASPHETICSCEQTLSEPGVTLIPAVNLLSVKGEILRKGHRRKKTTPSPSRKSSFMQGGFVLSSGPYCRAEKGQCSGTEYTGCGALPQAQQGMCAHPDSPSHTAQTAWCHMANYISYYHIISTWKNFQIISLTVFAWKH